MQIVRLECNLLMQSANQSDGFVSFVLSVLPRIKLYKFQAAMQSTNEGTTNYFWTGLQTLVSNCIAQNNTLDEFRNDSYIINFYMLKKNSNISWHKQLKFFQLQFRYQSVEKWRVFTLTKTIQITNSRSKYTNTMHTQLDTGIERRRKLIGIRVLI